jgi:hypothetical protein
MRAGFSFFVFGLGARLALRGVHAPRVTAMERL